MEVAAGLSLGQFFRRPREPAEPRARPAGGPVTVRPADSARLAQYAPDLAEEIRTAHGGETVLVVSHSNLVPQIVEALGGTAVAPMGEDEYDRLYVVVIPAAGPARTVAATY